MFDPNNRQLFIFGAQNVCLEYVGGLLQIQTCTLFTLICFNSIILYNVRCITVAQHTVCPRSLDPFHKEKTFWKLSTL